MTKITDIDQKEFLVSEDHIINGKEGSYTSCPIALCLSDAVKNLEHRRVSVSNDHATFHTWQYGYIHDFYSVFLSTDIQDWIREYDTGDYDMEPIKIKLDTTEFPTFYIERQKS